MKDLLDTIMISGMVLLIPIAFMPKKYTKCVRIWYQQGKRSYIH